MTPFSLTQKKCTHAARHAKTRRLSTRETCAARYLMSRTVSVQPAALAAAPHGVVPGPGSGRGSGSRAQPAPPSGADDFAAVEGSRRAVAVVVASFAAHFTMFGIIYSYGESSLAPWGWWCLMCARVHVRGLLW